ncbi:MULTISPECIES: hypothetical protein [unclassified Aureimonas]|nr:MULTISPECIES: hypothetical protein [unclassified Aureimonas]
MLHQIENRWTRAAVAVLLYSAPVIWWLLVPLAFFLVNEAMGG